MVWETIADLLCMWAEVIRVLFILTVDINPEFDENDKTSAPYLQLLADVRKLVSNTSLIDSIIS